MKLGLLLFPALRGSAQLARMAEGLGFDSLVFADTQNITPEVWGQLMLAARDTQRIELGTGVTNPGTRDAAVTASAALALQVESGGRAVCGIGRGDSSLGTIGFSGMKPEAMDPAVRQAALHLREHYDLRDHGRAETAHAQNLDDAFVDGFGIVGPVETALPRFERLKALGLDFCRVIPGSRDAAPDITGPSLLTLANVMRPAVA